MCVKTVKTKNLLGSWRILLLYPYHAASRLARYSGYALRYLRRDPRQSLESQSDIALRSWLKIP